LPSEGRGLKNWPRGRGNAVDIEKVQSFLPTRGREVVVTGTGRMGNKESEISGGERRKTLGPRTVDSLSPKRKRVEGRGQKEKEKRKKKRCPPESGEG